LHELAIELAPVTPWFAVLFCVVVFLLLCVGGFAFGFVWW